jgi:peptidoglycan/xylan/chitin deacetylase (PgdA/CDA1 family)
MFSLRVNSNIKTNMIKTARARFFWGFFLGFVLSFLGSADAQTAVSLPQDSSKAVVLAYVRVGDDNAADASLSLEKFIEHIQILEQGAYEILPLGEILNTLAQGKNLPPRSLAITFDGAHRSNAVNAFPLLIEKNIPFTIFFSSNALDQSAPDSMRWEELKTLQKNPNVTLGVFPAAYEHLAHRPKTEITASLNKARKRFREEFNHEAALLAYPYGEYSQEMKTLAQTQGFKAAFGLQSGVLYSGSDFFSLPRFTMTERYADKERLEMILNSLPLPVEDITPADSLIKDPSGEWYSGFTLPQSLVAQSRDLSCILSGIGAAKTEILGPRVEVRSPEPTLAHKRLRMNCTLRGPDSEDKTPQWRWFGMLYHRTTNLPSNSQPDALPAPQE